MSYQTINNGAFDDDGTAEKIRDSFQKTKEMFAEIYGTIPDVDPDNLAGETGKVLVVNAAGDAFELATLPGGGDLLSTNNLADIVNAATARGNLGLGTAATQASSAFATAAQGTKADNALASVVAGIGISIDATDPNNPIITNDETNDYLSTVTFAPLTGILTFTLLGTGTINLDLSAYTVLKIDGYQVEKGAGNTNPSAIEIGDTYSGWASATRYVVGKVNALPYTTGGNTDFAIDTEI